MQINSARYCEMPSFVFVLFEKLYRQISAKSLSRHSADLSLCTENENHISPLIVSCPQCNLDSHILNANRSSPFTNALLTI